ncbi:methyl-accepting chemotaxis protein [Treponema sp. R6D11]
MKNEGSVGKTAEKRGKSSVLSRKIIILCLSLTLSISIAGAVILIKGESKNAHKYMHDMALDELRYINLDIEKALMPALNLTENVAAMVPSIRTYAEMKSIIESLLPTVDAVFEIYYGTLISRFNGGNFICATDWDPYRDSPVWDQIKRPWFITSMQSPDKTVITEPYEDTSTGQMCVSMVRTVRDKGNIIGVVGTDVYLDVLTKIVIDRTITKDGNTFIIDNQGTFVVYKDPSRVMKEDDNFFKKEGKSLKDLIGSDINIIIEGNTYWGSMPVSGMDWHIITTGSTDEFYVDFWRNVFIVILISVAIVLIAIFVSLRFSKILTHPIISLIEVLKSVSNGDLSRKVTVKSNDEIGNLVDYFNHTIENIRNLIGTIKYKINAMTNTGHELTVNINKTSKSVDHISANFDGMKGKMGKQEKSAAEASKSVQGIKNNIEKLNKLIASQVESINTSSSAVEQMTANINSVTKTLIENSKNVNTLTEASENGKTGLQLVAQEIQGIAKDSEGLLQINSLMNSIASQTNLLSMNAAIEAAHAGEAGRGFAVVADEIRKLAETSGKQSKTTATMLKKIKTSIDNITKSSNEVLERFGAIDSSVKTVSQHEQNILNAMEEQEEGGKQILEAIGNLKDISVSVKEGAAEMVESGEQMNKQTGEFIEISNEIMGGMNEIVNGAVKEIKEAVVFVDEISEENNKNFDNLKEESKKFKVDSGNEKKKIIVIDDEETDLIMAKSMLADNYDITTVNSGKKALTLFFQGYTPDLVLLDLVMPEMDGWDTFVRIRDLTKLHEVPIAIYSVSDDPNDREHAQNMGAIGFIHKPINKEDMLATVAKLVK